MKGEFRRRIVCLTLLFATSAALALAQAASPAPTAAPPKPAAPTEPSLISLLPTVFDAKIDGMETYARNYDVGLQDALREVPGVRIGSVSQANLSPDYAGLIYANQLNPLTQAMNAVTTLKGRFFGVSLVTKPSNGALSVYSWIFDSRSGRTLAEGRSSGPFDLSSGLRAREVGEQLSIQLVAADLARLPGSFIPSNKSVAVTRTILLTSRLDGVEVSLPDGRKLGTVNQGTLSLNLAVERKSELTLELNRTGYFPARKSFPIGNEENPTVNIGDLYPRHPLRLGLGWSLNLVSNGGVSLSGFFSDDEYLIWEGGFNLFVLGIPSVTKGGNTASSAYPEIYGTVGSYLFFHPDSFFRPYVKTGFGLMAGFPAFDSGTTTMDVFLKPIVIGLELNFEFLTLSTEVYYRYYLDVFDSRLFQHGFPAGNAPRIDYFARIKL